MVEVKIYPVLAVISLILEGGQEADWKLKHIEAISSEMKRGDMCGLAITKITPAIQKYPAAIISMRKNRKNEDYDIP